MAPATATMGLQGRKGRTVPPKTNRRTFIKRSLLTPAAALAVQAGAAAQDAQAAPAAADALSRGTIGDLEVSRILLGGNLLTHFTHSRDLKYVYNLTAHYNTEEKIRETMALAEQHGVNTLVIHTAPGIIEVLKRYRQRDGGKIQWIICPTAPVDDAMTAYTKQVQELADEGVEAIYLWGVTADRLVAERKTDLLAKAVEVAKDHGLPSGVGAHDLNVIKACEEHAVGADFYIKTFHHHRYPSAPRPDELTATIRENPGYWCRDPEEVHRFMQDVEKPWIAFKVMAAGAIPPEDAFRHAFEHGADHVLAGMFDFEIAEDVGIANKILANVSRTRPWRS